MDKGTRSYTSSPFILPVAVAAALLASCTGGTDAKDADLTIPDALIGADAPPATVEASGIDILFVVDNSGSMREEQASLVANFNRFINILNDIAGGLPDIHIGVVSTDIGAGPYGIMGCTGNGDNGVLQNAPVGGACSTPSDKYIVDIKSADGLSRVANYTGTLAETFSCIAELGTNGCGFEQPLEAMRRALNGSNAENLGFLRADAALAVVIITDEDDCSVENLAMFDSDPALDNVDSAIGPLTSFRCFEFGVACEPDTPRVAGPRTACAPRQDSTYMYDVNSYVEFLKGLKSDPGLVLVAGIIGNATPVVVGTRDSEPTLNASCTSASGDAVPGIRLQSFLRGFPARSTGTTICNDDLSDALTLIADLLADVVVAP